MAVVIPPDLNVTIPVDALQVAGVPAQFRELRGYINTIFAALRELAYRLPRRACSALGFSCDL